MEFVIGDVIVSKKDPDRKFKVVGKWNNYWNDAMLELQSLKNPEYLIKEFHKYAIQDFDKMNSP